MFNLKKDIRYKIREKIDYNKYSNNSKIILTFNGKMSIVNISIGELYRLVY